MSKPTKPKFGPNEFDTRVRERFITSGKLDPKHLEKHLSELKDVESQSEPVELKQPAFANADGAADDEDDGGDED